ncbi:tetratricopeptide repeat protein [Colwellia sp. MSW7]|uniref:Tetratricopeptide repeat protein n=1 Tax=Colwellia maritima TaxID=2912588 RepID=A0ABS9X629_9GAMM|nr:tetratricopeptide repeat protein [Colwellia maritima]MCI2285674.1 tetratricopeptide repeat protein [Colwellia maritima]
MRRKLLLSIFLFSIALNVQALSIDDQVAEIQKLEDKSIVVNRLSKLLSNNLLSHSQRLNILLVQGRSYLMLSDLQKALITIQEAKVLATQENFPLQQAQVNKLLGIVFYYQGQYEQALSAYQSALDFFKYHTHTVLT